MKIRALGLLALSAVVLTGWQDSSSRKGEILVSNSVLVDPNFSQTAVLVLEDNEDGAIGLILNRPGTTIKKARLYSALGIDLEPSDSEAEESIFWGGPVQRDKMFILHSSDVTTEESQEITPDVAMTDVAKMLNLIAHNKGPEHYQLFMGYAGWGPGQLDMEMDVSSWVLVPGRSEFVFPDAPKKLWRLIMDEFTMRL